MKKTLIYILLCFMPSIAFAQKEWLDVRHGNRQFNKENYTGAEIDYRKGLEQNNNSFEAHFNLGDALFRQEKYAEALEEFQKAGALIQPKDGKFSKEDKAKLAKVHHNMGNCSYALQQYDKAVESFKKSLMANPTDDETRYNLVKAMQKLREQQQQQQQQNQDQQQQEQQQQDQQQQQQDQQDQQQDQQDPPQQDQQDQQMDKEQAEQLLQALQQDEQETQEKAKRQQMNSRFHTDKDW